jgi:ferrous iron transport protein B
MDAIDAGFEWLGGFGSAPTCRRGCSRSFLTDGVIAGVGSVLVFLPQILILFFFIILLEDFGYMARAAFLMDRIMGGAGLHGRAFIPLLSSFACAIPGIMATRVIDNKRDRLTTILVAPLMTCSARIPVYTLIIAAFIPNTGLGLHQPAGPGDVRPLCRRHRQRARRLLRHPQDLSGGAVEPFMMELPTYKLPDAENVLRNLWTRAPRSSSSGPARSSCR